MLLRTRRAVRIVKRSNCKYINSYYYVCSLGAKQNNDKKQNSLFQWLGW